MSDDSPTPPAATATVEWWCDLECPDCRDALPDVRALRSGPARVELRHFPLPKHQHAHAAAEAAEEAFGRGEDAGWAYVEAVLGAVERLGAAGVEALLEAARATGLDAEELDTALVDGRHSLAVEADQAEGKAVGVTGTPTYVVRAPWLDGGGQVRLDGGQGQQGLRLRIEELVAARPEAS